MSQHSTAIPAASAGYEAARHRAAFHERLDRGRLIISGRDRASYLHGLLTNDLAALAAGQGCYAAYLTPQGRMIADLYVYELGDIMLLAVPLAVKDVLLAKFEQFIFSEDVQLSDATDVFAEFAIVGPAAAERTARLLQDVADATLAALAEHGSVRAAFDGQPVIVVRTSDSGVPSFDVFAARAQAAAFAAACTAAGIVPLAPADAEALRIEAGVPRFGADMDEETIPLEAGIESRAISFTKGCYVGQEVIIRIMHRGHGRVARRLVGLTMDDGPVPSAGTTIRSGEREIGLVTSSTRSPALGKPIALGYVQRDFATPGTPLHVGDVTAQVAALPFVS